MFKCCLTKSLCVKVVRVTNGRVGVEGVSAESVSVYVCESVICVSFA